MPSVMLYVHIGTPKTGTTTVQKSLWENRQALAQAGWLYPETGCTGYGHHNLARALTGPNFPGIYEKLHEEIQASGLNKVILSSEVFATLLPEEVQAFKENIADYQVRIIVYLRRQDQFIYSHWAQGIKYMTVSATFDEWVDMRMSSPRNITNYDKLMKKWSEPFTRQNITLRVFDKNSLQGHIFHDVLMACDVPHPERYAYSPDVNVSPDVKTLEIIRSLNEKSGLHRNPRYREASHLLGSLILNYFAGRASDAKSGNVISSQTLDKIWSRYEESNRLVAREYLGRDQLFDAPAPGQASPYVISQLSGTEAIEMFAYVLPRLFDGLARIGSTGSASPVPAPAAGQQSGGWVDRVRRMLAGTPLLNPLRRIYRSMKRSRA